VILIAFIYGYISWSSEPAHSPSRLGYATGPRFFGGPKYLFLYIYIWKTLKWLLYRSKAKIFQTIHTALVSWLLVNECGDFCSSSTRVHFFFIFFIVPYLFFGGPKFKLLYISQKIKPGLRICWDGPADHVGGNMMIMTDSIRWNHKGVSKGACVMDLER